MHSHNAFLVSLFMSLSLIIISPAQSSISCKNELNQTVDWFYIYKLPAQYDPSNTADKGLQFVYITSDSVDWKLSDKNIGQADSLLGYTVSAAFAHINRLVLAYNDEPPGAKTDGLNGHTKGMVVANEEHGFWLIHSVPMFPNLDGDEGYAYPETGHLYGQSALCISVNGTQVNKIGKQLLYNEPHVYEFKVPDHLRALYPDVVKAAAGERIRVPPFWNEEIIISTHGIYFKSFAKTRRFGKDLYEDWLAPVLNTDLYVETWRHGGGNIPSNCTRTTRVWNVIGLKMDFLNFEFATLEDHSKWSVGAASDGEEQSNWICIGDINRSEHQKRRGGGTVCQRSGVIAAAYRSLIHKFEPCELP